MNPKKRRIKCDLCKKWFIANIHNAKRHPTCTAKTSHHHSRERAKQLRLQVQEVMYGKLSRTKIICKSLREREIVEAEFIRLNGSRSMIRHDLL